MRFELTDDAIAEIADSIRSYRISAQIESIISARVDNRTAWILLSASGRDQFIAAILNAYWTIYQARAGVVHTINPATKFTDRPIPMALIKKEAAA